MSEPIQAAWAMKVASTIKDNFTMADILSLTNSFGASNNIPIRYTVAPPRINKQNVAQQNISRFSVAQVIQFVSEIIESGTGNYPEQIENLLKELIKRFPNELSIDDSKSVSELMVRFVNYQGVPEVWKKAQINLSMKNYRESIDNARLALELFFKSVFNNSKSLENQKSEIGTFLSNRPKEFRDLIITHIRSYEMLQNQQVKHNLPSGLDEDEIRYILNTTYLIMDYMEKKLDGK